MIITTGPVAVEVVGKLVMLPMTTWDADADGTKEIGTPDMVTAAGPGASV